MKISSSSDRVKSQSSTGYSDENNKRIVMKHIGSAHCETALNDLLLLAEEWIKDYGLQLSIFPDENPNQLLHLNRSTFVGITYRFFYQQIELLQQQKGFDSLPVFVRDLATMRICEPVSKLRSIDLMAQYFGNQHSRKTFYKVAPESIQLQDIVEQNVLSFAKTRYLLKKIC